ncbi:MAG: bacterial Ig-like domain-containing protein, partial [Anaeroplasmataceae bacterium]|nr:bacterial Ig-like domain-containing protein [Anaeroplasmataceae bacterium]
VGTLENGVLTLTKDNVVSVYVKNDSPEVYADNASNVVYKYTNLYVIEKNNVDYVATLTGEFAVGNLVTFAYADTSIKFRVASLAGASWGTLESAGQHAGEYTFSDSEDVLVLDGFGPTNGKLGDAKLNDADVSYAMVGYMQNMLIISADATEKYYQMDGRVLTEVTASDGMQGKFVSNASESSYYEVSGLGYYKRSGVDYYDKYEFNSSANTIKLNSTTYTIYHNGNVLSTGTSHYVKEGYDVTTKDFTDYVDVVYENTDNQIKVRVTKPSGAYKVVVLEAVTLNGVEFTATTYDAVYVLDRLVFNGVELVLSDTLDLVIAEETYTLTEFVPEKTLAEKVVGVYVNGNYYVRVYDDEGTLKACYGSSINPYSQPSFYTCTITDEDNGKLEFTPYSSAYDFTYSEVENVGRITFGTSSSIDSSYRGKEFVAYDDSTVELRAVSGASITAGGYAPGASTLAKIYENNELKSSWTNISYTQTLTADQRNTVGVLDVEVYAWVYGKKHTVVSQLTITESWDLTTSSKSIYATEENYTKADIIALGMFTPKHNGTAVEVTEDMLTLPTGFDTTKAGTYTITCTYHEITKTATLTVNANPAGHYNYTSGETSTYYGTYFSTGLDIEMVDGKLNLIVGSTTLTNIKSGNTYTINSKDIEVTIANDKITLTYWQGYTDHSTVYTKEKEVDVTKYVGLYVNGNYYVRLFAEDKKLKAYCSSSICTSSDPTVYECTVTDDDAGAAQIKYSSYTNAFTLSEVGSQRKITFSSASTVDYSYRGKEFTEFDDSTVELVSKNYESKCGNSIYAYNIAKVRLNNEDQSWTGLKFVTNLTDDQRNTLGDKEAEVTTWVYGKKYTATISYTVVENYALSYSNKTIETQEGYGKAEIIASGMFTAKHNNVVDTITEDMITLPAGFDSNVAGTYTITCTYYTETKTATLTVVAKVDFTGTWTTSNTESYVKENLTFVKNDNGTYNISYGTSTTWKNITLPLSGSVSLDDYYSLTINATNITLEYERGYTWQSSTYTKQA